MQTNNLNHDLLREEFIEAMNAMGCPYKASHQHSATFWLSKLSQALEEQKESIRKEILNYLLEKSGPVYSKDGKEETKHEYIPVELIKSYLSNNNKD